MYHNYSEYILRVLIMYCTLPLAQVRKIQVHSCYLYQTRYTYISLFNLRWILHTRNCICAYSHRRNCICAFTVRTTCLPTCTSVVQASPWPSDHRHVILNRESSLGQNNISVGRDEPWYDIRFIVPKSQVPGHSVRVWTSWLRSSGSDQHTPGMARHCRPTGRSSTKFDPESLLVSSYPIPSRDRSGSC